jgi:TonB family protein
MSREEKSSVARPIKRLFWAAIGISAALLIWVALRPDTRGESIQEASAPVDDKNSAVPESRRPGDNLQRSADAAPAVPSPPAFVDGEKDLSPANIGPEGVLRVGGDVTKPELIKDSRPVYSEAAKAQRIRGSVIISATIDRDGHVRRAHVLSEDNLVARANLEAIRKRRYRPATQQGKPVAVEMVVIVHINLQ